MGLFGSAVRVNDGGPKMLDAGGPAGSISCTGIAPVDYLEARLDLFPIPRFYCIEEEFHRVRHFDSMPSGQSVNQFAARLAEPGKLPRDDFCGGDRWCNIRF